MKTCEPFYHVYSSPSLALDRQLTAVFISISYPFIAAWHIVTAGQIELVSLAMNNSTFLVVVSALFLSSLVASAQHQEHQKDTYLSQIFSTISKKSQYKITNNIS